MRRVIFYKCILLVILCVLVLFLIYNLIYETKEMPKTLKSYHITSNLVNKHSIKTNRGSSSTSASFYQQDPMIYLSIVACDSRFYEALNVVKSVLIFTRTPIYFVIFSDDEHQPKFNEILTRWKNVTKGQLHFELQNINFPEKHKDEWMNLFSKCSAQRLFMPKLLTHIDSTIYVDTDTLFLGPVDELWSYFSQFNNSQICAMALEADNPNVSWYPRFAQHPFYGKYGINAGMMLMNMTRMRSFGWTEYLTPIMLKYKLVIPWGDQDILNVLFHYHSDAMMELSCRYNYREDQCMYGDACADALRRGVYLLHGSRKIFHRDKQPAFQAVYRAIEEFELETDSLKTLVEKIDKYITESPPSNCGSLKDTFLKTPAETLKQISVTPVR